MATNPITSESLTVDFKSLMKIPVGDRMKSASISPDFLQSILNALTPIQIANAFPNYYKRQLPDVSNFITSYIASRNGGNFNQTGGGDDGSASPFYDGEDKPDGSSRPAGSELSIKDMKEKLLAKGIDVDNTFGALEQGPVLAGDERVQFIKNLSTDKLLELGIEKYQDENGRDLLKLRPVAAENMTDEQIQTEMKKQADSQEGTYRPVYPLSDIDLSPAVINTIAGEALNNKESIDGVINNMLNRVGAQGDWTNLKDVARASGQYAGYRVASEEQAEVIKARIKEIASGKVASNIGAATEFRAEYYVKGEGYGKTFEREARKQGYKQPGPGDNIYAETFAAGPYAPRKTEEVEKIKTENAAKINKAFTPEEIKAYREQSIKEQRLKIKEDVIRETYNTPSPTSSEFPASKDGETRVSIEGEKLRPVGTDYDSLKEFWSQRNPRTDINRVMEVDPDLLKAYAEAVQQYEAANPGLKVELFGPSAASRDSGSTSNHGVKADGYSKALDFAIIDRASGKQITNLGKEGYSGQVGGSEVAAREYTRLHSLARIAQEHYAPHESNLRQGGGFVQGVTADWMHGDIQSENMAAYSWEKGYDPNFRRQYNIQENLILGKEERIKELGQQIYGQVDESGYYTNRADFSQLEDGNTTVVSKKVEKPKDDIVASAQPEPSPATATPPVSPPVETLPTVTEQTPVAATQPVAVEPKEVAVAAAPQVESKETTAATSPPPPEDVRKFALGGNIYEPNEDMTLVDTETGNPIAQIGNDERIEKTGNAIQVTPETKLKADELTNKYDSSTEMEDRMANIEDNMQSQQSLDKTNQVVQKAKEPEKAKTDAPYRWRESLASAERPVSPSFNRAMARSKFFGEGHHFNRSAPGSQS